ncbi:hypothetical protein SO802_002613, partial [Lithocarpus litseifolius]
YVAIVRRRSWTQGCYTVEVSAGSSIHSAMGEAHRRSGSARRAKVSMSILFVTPGLARPTDHLLHK